MEDTNINYKPADGPDRVSLMKPNKTWCNIQEPAVCYAFSSAAGYQSKDTSTELASPPLFRVVIHELVCDVSDCGAAAIRGIPQNDPPFGIPSFAPEAVNSLWTGCSVNSGNSCTAILSLQDSSSSSTSSPVTPTSPGSLSSLTISWDEHLLFGFPQAAPCFCPNPVETVWSHFITSCSDNVCAFHYVVMLPTD